MRATLSEGTTVSSAWSASTDWETVCRRNAGRRRYNALRRLLRDRRRRQVLDLLLEDGLLTHGAKARVARALGVHKSTITRDVAAILHTHATCPTCESVVPLGRFERE
jgi:transposase